MSGNPRRRARDEGSGSTVPGRDHPLRRRGRGAESDSAAYGLFGQGSIGRLVVLFMLAGLGAFVLCGVGLTLAQRHAALEEAVRDARVTTALLTSRVVQPALPSGPPARLATDQAFDRVVRERVLGDPVSRVQIADEAGLVVYATDPSLVGQRVALSTADLEALQQGTTAARRDDGSDPTRLTGGRSGQLLEVSAGLRSPSGQRLVLQSLQPYEVVWMTSRMIWLTTLPSLVVALTVLYLIKAAFAYRLSRDLHGVQDGREQLLLTTLAAADRERTLIASDLHDGVVQGLAGASYTLSDTAKRSREAGQPEVADTLTETAGSLRQWVRELRGLIVTVTPPALHSEGLQATLTDLVATLEARKVTVELDVSVTDEVTETAESLVYRVAQESVRNIVRHANATHVTLTVAEVDGWIRLQVSDDGDGFDPSASARRPGSFGLNLLAALAHQSGGQLRVESAIGHGTTVTLRLPAGAGRGSERVPSATPIEASR
jgi:two-component system, NarL family, sensor kinase